MCENDSNGVTDSNGSLLCKVSRLHWVGFCKSMDLSMDRRQQHDGYAMFMRWRSSLCLAWWTTRRFHVMPNDSLFRYDKDIQVGKLIPIKSDLYSQNPHGLH